MNINNNKFNTVIIIDKVEIEGNRKTATIIEAKPDKTSVKPGETVALLWN